jgi:hypothetical protein
MGVILFLIMWILFLPLSVINYFFVDTKKGYFYDSALNGDKYLNRELRSMWNKLLITDNGYKFGNINESISEVLGRNILKNTLTKKGKLLVKLLTEKHCLDAIQL